MSAQLASASQLDPDSPGAQQLPSLESLYDEYADFVYRTLVGQRLEPHEAEDAMQDVFMVAQRRLHEFQGTFFRAWLYQIAISTALNAKRSHFRSRQRAADVELERLEAPSSHGPEARAAHSERVQLLQRLLSELSAKEREVFALVELEQLTHEEAALALGVHVNTVANRLRGARAALERLLEAHASGAQGAGT